MITSEQIRIRLRLSYINNTTSMTTLKDYVSRMADNQKYIYAAE